MAIQSCFTRPGFTRPVCLTLALLLAIMLLLALGAATAGRTKPMPQATLAEAVKQSPLIVVAAYESYEGRRSQIRYFAGPQARYRLVKTLKGDAPPATFQVRYDFTDGSACLAPKNWRFNPAAMPAKNSRWILFLKPATTPGSYTTYRGHFGRVSTLGDSQREILDLLNQQP